MLKSRRHKLINTKTGEQLKPTQLWGFDLTLRDKLDPTIKIQKMIEGYYIGQGIDARKIAKKQQESIAKEELTKTVYVEAVALEMVGPIMHSQLQGLQMDNRMQDLVAFDLAEKLARLQAERSLELNPDIGGKTHQLVLDARKEVAEKLKAAAAQQQAPALVGPDEQPVQAEPRPDGIAEMSKVLVAGSGTVTPPAEAVQ